MRNTLMTLLAFSALILPALLCEAAQSPDAPQGLYAPPDTTQLQKWDHGDRRANELAGNDPGDSPVLARRLAVAGSVALAVLAAFALVAYVQLRRRASEPAAPASVILGMSQDASPPAVAAEPEAKPAAARRAA